MEGCNNLGRRLNISTLFQNSIRHNLSLHQRFVKIPNEDAGKSSWWTINNDPKPGVKQRRRATYGDSRDRLKKRADLVRSRGRLMKSSSSTLLYPAYHPDSVIHYRSNSSEQSSSDDASLTLYSDTDSTRLSPFRPRSYSNTSSASQSSVTQLSEFTCYQQSINDDLSTDLAGIDMSDLSLGTDFMKEFLSPAPDFDQQQSPETQSCQQNNVTVTENILKYLLHNFNICRSCSRETMTWCVNQ